MIVRGRGFDRVARRCLQIPPQIRRSLPVGTCVGNGKFTDIHGRDEPWRVRANGLPAFLHPVILATALPLALDHLIESLLVEIRPRVVEIEPASQLPWLVSDVRHAEPAPLQRGGVHERIDPLALPGRIPPVMDGSHIRLRVQLMQWSPAHRRSRNCTALGVKPQDGQFQARSRGGLREAFENRQRQVRAPLEAPQRPRGLLDLGVIGLLERRVVLERVLVFPLCVRVTGIGRRGGCGRLTARRPVLVTRPLHGRLARLMTSARPRGTKNRWPA